MRGARLVKRPAAATLDLCLLGADGATDVVELITGVVAEDGQGNDEPDGYERRDKAVLNGCCPFWSAINAFSMTWSPDRTKRWNVYWILAF